MAERIVGAHSQAGKLLRRAGLQARVVAACAGAELIDVAKTRIERLIVGERREATVAYSLVAIQLDLVRLLHGARPNVIDPQRAACTEFALQPKAPLKEVRRLQRAAGKHVEIDGKR